MRRPAVQDPSAPSHLPADSRCTQGQLRRAKPSPQQQSHPAKCSLLGSKWSMCTAPEGGFHSIFLQ